MCYCGDRPRTECPGEWEPGCDLGANEAHVRYSKQPVPALLPRPRFLPTRETLAALPLVIAVGAALVGAVTAVYFAVV